MPLQSVHLISFLMSLNGFAWELLCGLNNQKGQNTILRLGKRDLLSLKGAAAGSGDHSGWVVVQTFAAGFHGLNVSYKRGKGRLH